MITVESVSKTYGTFTAVDNVSFAAHPGRVTGFLVPNGAGKSTTLRKALAGITGINGSATGDIGLIQSAFAVSGITYLAGGLINSIAMIGLGCSLWLTVRAETTTLPTGVDTAPLTAASAE